MTNAWAVPAAVYRWYDTAGELLYIGFSTNLEQRFRDHRGWSARWREVARIDLTWYPTRYEARDAEKQAIAAENPRWNATGPKRLAENRCPECGADGINHCRVAKEGP